MPGLAPGCPLQRKDVDGHDGRNWLRGLKGPMEEWQAVGGFPLIQFHITVQNCLQVKGPGREHHFGNRYRCSCMGLGRSCLDHLFGHEGPETRERKPCALLCRSRDFSDDGTRHASSFVPSLGHPSILACQLSFRDRNRSFLDPASPNRHRPDRRNHPVAGHRVLARDGPYGVRDAIRHRSLPGLQPKLGPGALLVCAALCRYGPRHGNECRVVGYADDPLSARRRGMRDVALVTRSRIGFAVRDDRALTDARPASR